MSNYEAQCPTLDDAPVRASSESSQTLGDITVSSSVLSVMVVAPTYGSGTAERIQQYQPVRLNETEILAGDRCR